VIGIHDVVLRLAIALVFGMIVGVEREWRQKHAGLKTMALVTLGAAAFAMMSNTFGPLNHNPGQMAAAVVGGIGFIGAGVIMHRGTTVQGVTTAATLWASASIGVAAGLGYYVLSATLTGAIVIVQFVGRSFETVIHTMRHPSAIGRFELRVDCESESLQTVNATWAEFPEVTPIRRSVQRGREQVTLRVVLRTAPGVDLRPLEESLVAIRGVTRVEVRHLGIEE
jgi:putative Mg2+ transporter-C (MgtC) family protein